MKFMLCETAKKFLQYDFDHTQAFKMSQANSCTSGIVVGMKIFMLVKDL